MGCGEWEERKSEMNKQDKEMTGFRNDPIFMTSLFVFVPFLLPGADLITLQRNDRFSNELSTDLSNCSKDLQKLADVTHTQKKDYVFFLLSFCCCLFLKS